MGKAAVTMTFQKCPKFGHPFYDIEYRMPYDTMSIHFQ